MHSAGTELSVARTGKELPHLHCFKRARVARETQREINMLKTGLCVAFQRIKKMTERILMMNLQFLLFTLEVLTPLARWP